MSQLITNKLKWETIVSKLTDANFLQSWNWGETHRKLGKKIIRASFTNGVAQIIKEEAKRGTYLTCPGGPLIPWNQKNLKEFVSFARDLAHSEKAIFTRIRPQVSETPQNRKLLKDFKFISAPMHMHAETTWQLDLSPSENELLRNMRKTTRYLIRKAQTMGVKIEICTDSRTVDMLFNLEIETAKRQSFVPFPKTYLKSHFDSFVSDNQIVIFNGFWQEQVISAAMIVFFNKEAVYHYSGSSGSFPDVPVNYLLQWEAIREAKKRGCKIYNFWGIAPTDNPRHRFAGVTTFKKGFGRYRLNHLHAHDLPASLLYWPNFCFESARRVLRRL